MRLMLLSRRGPVRIVELGDPRLRLCVCVLLLVAVGGCIASGAVLALRIRRPASVLQETVVLHRRIDAQRRRLSAIRNDAQRNVNALGVAFARLQAEDVRRTALGTRIAGGLNLDDAELTRIFFLQLSVVGSTMGTRGELAALVNLLDATGARPLIDRTLPMADAAEGFAAMAGGDVFGKIVFTR